MADENTIPKHRLDQESEKRKAAEQALKDLQAEHGNLESKIADLERKQAEQDSDYKKLYEDEQKKVQRLQGKLSETEGTVKDLRTEALRKDQRATFFEAAQGVLRPEAIGDAFAMLPADDLDATDAANADAFKKMAQDLAERKTYLADSPRGAGSGGSDRQVVMAGVDGDKRPLPFGRLNKRRVN